MFLQFGTWCLEPVLVTCGSRRCQVLRDSKLKVTSPGVAFTATESEEWQRQACEFLRNSPAETPAAKRARLAKVSVSHPRLATLDQLRAWDHGLRVATARGLEAFLHAPLLDCPVGPDGLVQWPADSGIVPGKCPPILVCTSDQGPTNMCGLSFLVNFLGLNVVSHHDPHHRRWNDIQLALGMSGMRTPVLVSQTVHNIAYGPKLTASWSHLLQDSAIEISTSMSPNDPLLLHLWQTIADEHGFALDQRDESARARFLNSLPTSRAGCMKGPKSSLKRWFAWLHAHHFWRKQWTTKLLLIIFLSVRMKWAKTWTDFWLVTDFAMPVGGAGAGPAIGPVAEPASSALAVAASSSGGAASSSSGAAAASGAAQAVEQQGSAPAVQASTSKAADQKRAEDTLDAARKSTHNSVHAVGRLLANADLKRDCYMVALATRVWADEHSDATKNLRSVENTIEFYSKWAHWSWMSEFKSMIRTGDDLSALGECGFLVNFSSLKRQMITLGSPVVKDQDAQMATYWKLCRSLLKTRSSSMALHSCSFPGILAGLLHSDTSQQQHSTDLFALHCRVFKAAEAVNDDAVRKIVSRHPLSSTAMRFAMKFFEAGGYKVVNSQLKDLLKAVYTAVGQSKLIEDAIKALRDHETRDSTNKTMCKMTCWEWLMSHKLWEQHGRTEVQLTTAASPPSSFNATLFEPVARSGEGEFQKGIDEELLDLKRVMGSVDWVNFHAQALMERVGEVQLLRHCFEKNNWELAGAGWMSELLPDGSFVTLPGGSDVALVIRAYNGAALLWPCERLASNAWQLDMNIGQLQWHTVENYKEYGVSAMHAMSPVSRALQSWLSGDRGMVFEVSGHEPLLQHLASRGFARMSEAVLCALCEDLDLAVCKEDVVTGQSFRDTLVLALVAMLLPDASESKALEIFYSAANDNDERGQNLIDYMDDDMVRDVLLLGDQETIVTFQKDRKKAIDSRVATKKAIAEFVTAKFGEMVEKAKRSMTAAAKKKAQKHAEQVSQRWRADLAKAPTMCLREHMPKSCNLCEDMPNGRYLLSHPAFSRKSVSWTQRGQVEAVQKALEIMWSWHHERSGENPPPELGIVL